MAQKIIALVDGSIYSASVCDHAAWVSARTGAAVELLHVLGRREGADKQDLSGAIRLGARTALMEELAELDAQRSKLIAH
ncbi:MAG: universal stress protein, partial [Paracoccaceae bacterium]